MQYQVLARKYRPKQFPGVVGQTHVVTALSNALTQQHLHHAYLFTGTRGVGKTTIARIFAKALNCEQGISANPCNQCSNCQEIDEGRFPDFFEVDAASRTKVEDTRELLENVQYMPAKGRFKIYLIDEVHMLSGHSFNALLKTLEEPPEHVKFLLATTDHQKLPATVLSRCLQFHLQQTTPASAAEHLATLLKKENIKFETSALSLIGRAANGSMRDALSLLDQCIAFGNGKVLDKDVRTLLGTIESTTLFAILHALSQRDGIALLQHIEKLNTDGVDFSHALNDLLSLLHQLSVIQVVPHATVEYSLDAFSSLMEMLTPEDTQLFYQIGLIGQRDFNYAPSPKIAFEMTLLRMLAFYPENKVTKPTIQKKPQPKKIETNDNEQWHEIVSQLSLSGAALVLAQNCSLEKITETQVFLSAQQKQKPLILPKSLERINETLSRYLQRPVKVTINIKEHNNQQTPAEIAKTQQENRKKSAKQTLSADPNIQQIMKTFDATLIENSINNNHDT
jgi:DNA polymerase III subunit gamma/tau